MDIIKEDDVSDAEVQKRGRIVRLMQAGWNTTDVAIELHTSEKTVRRSWNKFLNGEDFSDHRVHNSRPLKIPVQDELVRQYFTEEPFNTVNQFLADTRINVHRNTIERRLKRLGLISAHVNKKKYLSTTIQEERVGYALQYYVKLQEFWKNTVFIDEKKFCTTEDGRQKVWRQKGQYLSPKHVIAVNHSQRISTLFWGFITSTGLRQIRQIPGRMNGEMYVDHLENEFLPYLRQQFSEEEYPEIQVVHDNSKIHTCRIVKTWFNDHSELILLPHPPYSPDLNPIKNLWSTMQSKFRAGEATSLQELVDKIYEVWD